MCMNLGPDHLESIILKITGTKINNLFVIYIYLQSIISEKIDILPIFEYIQE